MRAAARRLDVHLGANHHRAMGDMSRSPGLRTWVMALYALMVLLTGLAHKPVSWAAESPADLAAYALPDGGLLSLCRGQGQTPTAPASSGASICDACLLTCSPGLPHQAVAMHSPTAAEPAFPAGSEAAPRRLHLGAASSRAPPPLLPV